MLKQRNKLKYKICSNFVIIKKKWSFAARSILSFSEVIPAFQCGQSVENSAEAL